MAKRLADDSVGYFHHFVWCFMLSVALDPVISGSIHGFNVWNLHIVIM